MSTCTKDSCERSTAEENQNRHWRQPRYEVHETEDGWNLVAEVPGVDKDSVELTVEDDTLKLVARRAQSECCENRKTHRREISRADYRLKLGLRVEVDSENVQASLEQGLLTIQLPRAAKARARKIAVN